jgi:hypothetical protein
VIVVFNLTVYRYYTATQIKENAMKLYTRYTIDLPQGTIANGGIALIVKLLDAQNLNADEWKAVNPNLNRRFLPDLPQDWSWEWLVTGKGDYVGTFPKRISKFFWHIHGIKCPQSLIQEIGNIARQHSGTASHYEFEFVDRFDWEAGDYGDKGSCYFGGHSAAREILQDNGALAICFYENEEGYARAWLAKLSDARFILFNGYGMPASPTLTIARIFATWLNLNYKKINLVNHGETGGMLYINAGSGYLIGTPEQLESTTFHDLEYGCKACYTCFSCDDELTEDEMYNAPNGEHYCGDCYYENWSDCEHCGDTCYRENMSYVEGVGDVCERCTERHYTYCDSCYDYHSNDEIVIVEGDAYCENCAERIATPCDNCGEWTRFSNITQTDNGTYCQDCKPKEENKE